jgi:hypothetical protein
MSRKPREVAAARLLGRASDLAAVLTGPAA